MASINRQTIFRGFSTVGADTARSWRLYDSALVRRDLLNHFMTRMGERVMRPTWGCRIWDYLMEPLTDAMRDLIIDEAVRICREDTRVEVTDVSVREIDYGLRVAISLNYLPQRVADTFSVDFESRQEAF